MYLKDDQIIVTIGSTTFRTYSKKDPQFILDENALSGWYDGASSRRQTVERSNTWGDFPEKATNGSRIISMTGTARATTSQQLQDLRDDLTGMLGDGEYREMKVETTDDVRYTTVGIEGTPSWLRLSDTVATWKIDLYAPDPRVYGAETRVHLGGGARSKGMSYPIKYPMNYGNLAAQSQGYITNRGNTRAWPKFVAQGNMPDGFIIHNNTGDQVSYLGVVTTQSPVTIDMSKGTATQNGVDRTSLINVRQWFPIEANSSLAPEFIPISKGASPVTNAWCDIIYSDTWI